MSCSLEASPAAVVVVAMVAEVAQQVQLWAIRASVVLVVVGGGLSLACARECALAGDLECGLACLLSPWG